MALPFEVVAPHWRAVQPDVRDEGLRGSLVKFCFVCGADVGPFDEAEQVLGIYGLANSAPAPPA
jgi:hypothetical protein